MDLPQNRLLGERRRASSTMHRSWRDFQPFDGTRVNRCIHRAISSHPAVVNVAEVTNVPDHRMKLIIQRRISVGIVIHLSSAQSLHVESTLIESQFSFFHPSHCRCDQQRATDERESLRRFRRRDSFSQKEFRW